MLASHEVLRDEHRKKHHNKRDYVQIFAVFLSCKSERATENGLIHEHRADYLTERERHYGKVVSLESQARQTDYKSEDSRRDTADEHGYDKHREL